MTIAILNPSTSFTVSGTGPYAIGWPYGKDTITAALTQDGGILALAAPTDFSVVPSSSTTAGNLYLTAAAAAAHAGKTLVIGRNTPAAQGWMGELGEREKGLEAQLDRIIMTQQEFGTNLSGALRIPGRVFPPVSLADGEIPMWQDGKFVPGPNAADIPAAQGNAAVASAAAATAQLYAPAYFESRAQMLASVTAWPTAQLLNIRSPGECWQVALASASDHHLTIPTTGKKLYEAGPFSSRARAAQAVARGLFASGQIILVANRRYRVDPTGKDGLIALDMNFHGKRAAMIADMSHGAAKKILCYGDSTTAGDGTTGFTPNPVDVPGSATATPIGTATHAPANAWPALAQLVARAMHDNTLISFLNGGFSGTRLFEGWPITNFDAALLNKPAYANPDAILVQFGLNDVGQPSFTPEAFRAQLLLLCDRIEQCGAFPIFITPDAVLTENKNGSDTARIVAIYREVAAQIGCDVIDWHSEENRMYATPGGKARWAVDKPDNTHGGDNSHAAKGAFIAYNLYGGGIDVSSTDVAYLPAVSVNTLNPGFPHSVVRGVHNVFGASINVAAADHSLGQIMQDLWIWNAGEEREIFWHSISGDAFWSDRNRAKAPTIEMYDYITGLSRQRFSPSAGYKVPDAGMAQAEAPGLLGTLSPGLTRVRYLATTDVTATMYLGYWSVRKKTRRWSGGVALKTVATTTYLDTDPNQACDMALGFGNGIDLNMLFRVSMPQTCGVMLWSGRIWGGATTTADNNKAGLMLYRTASDFAKLYLVTFKADGTGTAAELAASAAALTWTEATPFRLRAFVGAGTQNLQLFAGFNSSAVLLSYANPITNSPLPWGGAPGAYYQAAGVLGSILYEIVATDPILT